MCETRDIWLRTLPWLAVTVVALAAANTGAPPDPVVGALADIRDTRCDLYSLQSSIPGKLAGPAELAAAQPNLREYWRAGTSVAVNFSPEMRKELAREYQYVTLLGGSRLGSVTPLGISGVCVHDVNGRKDLVVVGTEKRSPADGLLERDEVIVGVNGRFFEEGEDPRVAAGFALAESQTAKLGGVLTLQVVGKEGPRNVPIKLGVSGAYSPTWPYDCEKSRKLADEAVKLIVENEPSGLLSLHHGGGYWTPLFLMASGDDAALELARRGIYSLVRQSYPEPTGGHSWNCGYYLVNLCEYYLLTGDSVVLPAIEYYKEVLENGQASSGSWGHGCPCGGYGEVNCVGLTCFIGLALARECGVAMDPVPLPRSIRFFGKFAGGGIPYGNHPSGPTGRSDNGANSQAGVAFHVLGEDELARRFVRAVCYMWPAREAGHAERIFSFAWGPLGAALAPSEEFQMFMNNMLWNYEVSRTREGGYWFTASGRFPYPAGSTGAVALPLMLPRKQIRITGAPRGVFGVQPPKPLENAAVLYRGKKWKELVAFLEAYLAKPDRGHAEYATALRAAYRRLEEHAAATLALVKGSIQQRSFDKAKKQLAALNTLLGEERPEMTKLREYLASDEVRALAQGQKKARRPTKAVGRPEFRIGPPGEIVWDELLRSGPIQAAEGAQTWIRRSFTAEGAGYSYLRLRTNNAGEVYLNGYKLASIRVHRSKGKAVRTINLRNGSAGALREGKNVLAARLTGRSIDISLAAGPRQADMTKLCAGLHAYWQFNEGQGNATRATVPAGRRGLIRGRANWPVGKFGAAVEVSSSPGSKLAPTVAILPPAQALDRTPGLTISFWVKVPSMAYNHLTLSDQPKDGLTGWRMELGGRELKFSGRTVSGEIVDVQAPPPGTEDKGPMPPGFLHWVLVYDAEARTVAVYRHGEPIGSRKLGPSMTAVPGQPVKAEDDDLEDALDLDAEERAPAGKKASSGIAFSSQPLKITAGRVAMIDEVAIWHRALSREEVLTVHSGAAGLELRKAAQ